MKHTKGEKGLLIVCSVIILLYCAFLLYENSRPVNYNGVRASAGTAVNEAKRVIPELEVDEVTESYNSKLEAMNKNILFIGDSYGVTYSNAEGAGWTGWYYQYRFLFPSCNSYGEPKGGEGFYRRRNGFARQLDTALADIENPEEITDIIVVGGYNDHKFVEDKLDDAVKGFADKCRETFPNADIVFMYVPMDYISEEVETELVQNEAVFRDVCKKYDIAFVENSIDILDSEEYIFWDEKDGNRGFHPNTEGARRIAIAIAKYLVDGEL